MSKDKRKAKSPPSAPAKASASKRTFAGAVTAPPPKVAAALQPGKFAGAVAAAPPPVNGALQPGKQALKKEHRAQITCADEKRWTGSVEMDAALAQTPPHASANRWDYGLGYLDSSGKENAVWVEVHSAETGEVSTVIRKLRWLKDYLREHCPDLRSLTRASPEGLRFVWVASGRYAILQNSPQMRALRTAGLDPPQKKLHIS